MPDEVVVPEVDGAEVVDPLAGVSAADVIPEEFAGRDPAEIKLLMSQMPRIVKAQKEELENLRVQMAGGGAPTVVHGAPEVVAPVASAEEQQATFEKLFDENPREAIRQFVVGEFGDRFAGMESRQGETDLSMMRGQIEDFHEYEEDVKILLTQSGAPATPQNIQGAYAMAVGQRAIQKKQVLTRAESNPLPVTAAPDVTEKLPDLTPLEDEVRQQMGLTVEEYSVNKGSDALALKIRT